MAWAPRDMPPDGNDRHRRARNLAIASALTAFAVLFFLITIAKLGGFQ